MAPQVLHNNRVKFPKDICLYCSVHQHGRCDVRCKPFQVTSSPPCWWKKTKDLLLATFVGPPAIVHYIICYSVSRGRLQEMDDRDLFSHSHCVRQSCHSVCLKGDGKLDGEMNLKERILALILDQISEVALERFSNECCKTKTKVITLANQKGRRQSSNPIKIRSNYT